VLPVIAFLPSVGVPELLIVLAIAILVLGPKRIPEAARSLGRGIRGFRDSVGGGSDEDGEEPKPSEPAKLPEKSKSEG
jgi:sec-independent protein translocase protein TatA